MIPPRPETAACCRASARSLPRRWRDAAGWGAPLVPAAGLALLPKCPACLAAYVAVGTGVGLSATAATHLRAALAGACVLSLLYLLVKRAWRYLG